MTAGPKEHLAKAWLARRVLPTRYTVLHGTTLGITFIHTSSTSKSVNTERGYSY